MFLSVETTLNPLGFSLRVQKHETCKFLKGQEKKFWKTLADITTLVQKIVH